MSPFIVLHVCMGNICRSPMAERLFAHAVRERSGGEDLVVSESAGTGGWHAGEPMNPPAARELRRRGVDPGGFRARRLTPAHIEAADLILTATEEQFDFVLGMRPDAAARTFVLGEFARLAAEVDPEKLPYGEGSAEGVHARGLALVEAVHAARGEAAPLEADDLDDPWGGSEAVFHATADRIVEWITPVVGQLL